MELELMELELFELELLELVLDTLLNDDKLMEELLDSLYSTIVPTGNHAGLLAAYVRPGVVGSSPAQAPATHS
jgi:hypothetical protein